MYHDRLVFIREGVQLVQLSTSLTETLIGLLWEVKSTTFAFSSSLTDGHGSQQIMKSSNAEIIDN